MRVKLVVSALLAFLVVVFVSQNTDVVRVTFLAWSKEVSLLLLIFIVFAAGIASGWLLNSYFRFARNRKKQLDQSPAVVDKTAQDKVDEVHAVEGEREEV